MLGGSGSKSTRNVVDDDEAYPVLGTPASSSLASRLAALRGISWIKGGESNDEGGEVGDDLAFLGNSRPMQNSFGSRPGVYRDGPGGGAPTTSPSYAVPSDHRSADETEPDVLLDAEPVLSIVVNATPLPMEIESPEGPTRPKPRRLTRRTIALMVMVTAAIAVAAIVGGKVGTSKSSTTGRDTGGDAPSETNPFQPSAAVVEKFRAKLPPYTIDRLRDNFSTQQRAYDWVTQLDQVPGRDEPRDEERRLFRMTQRFALATIFYSTMLFESWVNSTETECRWGNRDDFITCSANSTAVSFEAFNEGAGGTLPPEIGLLTDLTFLDLTFNRLDTSIPSELGHLSALEWLALDGNGITSSIPTELGMLSSLRDLSLSMNSLTSTIPTELGMLTALTSMILNSNHLTSTIPTALGLISNLETLELWVNLFTSSIPTELGLLSSLTRLDLSSNGLTSSIPAELGNLERLDTVFLHETFLTGSFPSSLCYVGPFVDGSGSGILIDCSEVSCTCCGC